ncbi:MAG: hypothetical protein HGA80_08365, partial [Candidatus Omnitrophica bacterium]|nr:hypothetical protein [Candidatus Omnitrophota bacterium]
MIKPCVRQAAFRKNISWLLILCFSFNTLLLNTLPANCAHASAVPAYTGVPSPALPSQNLPLLQGIRLSSEHPFELEFMIGSDLQPAPAPAETDKIIKYFLTFITIPDEDLWVNLSPAEPDRIIPPALGRTLAGQALLTFDYQLKQLAASITNPDTGPGRLFWSKVYAEASRLYGTTDIPLSAYNKVWFTPKRAIIYEKDNAALVSECSLQVMLESDYLAKTGTGQPDSRPGDPEISTRIYRDVIVPLLTRELNGSAEFRSLRQLLHSLVLAQWFKHRLHRNIITRLYGNHRKLDGLDEVQRQAITNIYDRYLESYRRGSYNFIREDLDRARNNLVPHKYFSGGFHAGRFTDWAQLRPVSYSPGLTGILDKLSKKIFRVTVTLSPVLTGEPSPARTPTTQATELPPAKNTVRPTVRTTTRALPLGVTGALLAPSVLQAGERSPVLLAALEGGSSALASIQDTLSNPYLSIAVPTTALFLWLLRNIFRNRSHVINNIDQLSQEKRFLQAVNLFLKAAPASPFQHQLAQPLVPGNPYTLQDIRTQRIGDKVDITLLASTGMVDLAPEKKTQIGQAFADAFAAGDIVARSGGDSLELEHVDISSRRISLILTGRLRSPPETLSSVEIACRDNSGGYSNIFQRPLANNQLAELSVLWESLLTMPSWDNDTVAGLILRIQEYRRNNPPEFTQFSEQANAFYRIRALALTSYRKLADTEDAPAQRAYFQQLFHYSNRIRFVMSHCGTLDSYKSHFLEQQDRIFMFRTPASLAEAMRKVFLVKLSFQKSIVAIRSCIPALIREDSLLNKLEQNITGQNAPTRTSAELEAKLDKFTRNLEFPANNSIEGPDLTRRHGQIYSFLKYLLGLPGIILLGTGMGQPLQAGIALLSSLTHLFYHRYLTSLMTPHLILRESETHNQLVPDLPADSYGGQTAAQQGTAQPEPQTQAPEEFS